MDIAVLILDKITKSNKRCVVLTRHTYEKLCPSLPREDVIKTEDGRVTFIHVNRDTLIKYLKEKYRLINVRRNPEEVKKNLGYS
jgi:hypothetical protein